MKIRTQLCDGEKALEEFLNNDIDYKGLCSENIILGITQDRTYYTVIYKDYDSK